MKEINITTLVRSVGYDELSAEDRRLVDAAKDATKGSYAPYSQFKVGAAILLENGEIAAVLIGNEATLKRFYRYGDTVVLRAENPLFKEIEYKNEEIEEVTIESIKKGKTHYSPNIGEKSLIREMQIFLRQDRLQFISLIRLQVFLLLQSVRNSVTSITQPSSMPSEK